MKEYNLLSEPIRRFIRDKRWEELRPIQAAAISKILTTDKHYILASRTASGKTEAAFLPVLSKADFSKKSVAVLYISPLIALINDQFFRIESLCNYLDIPVTKWHGEASRTLKEKIVKNPCGVVLITPESLEAILANKLSEAKTLFGNLQYIVIDEIHSFIGSDRGTHLQSILYRLQCLQNKPFTIVGLSATLGDYDAAKKFTGNEENTSILLDKTAKDIVANFRYFKQETTDLSPAILDDIFSEVKDKKVLLFPNNRGRAEEVAVNLKKRAERSNGHTNYFSHHSSVDKEVREYVEHFVKNNKRSNFCISCTSTLELGIDIGNVDEVIQLDATHSIASLIQRVGRSGRQEGLTSTLLLYSTNPWSLLQSIACWLLYKEQFIEPPLVPHAPYDILLHQILSLVKGHSGLTVSALTESLHLNHAFRNIPEHDIKEIIDHLIAIDFLERLGTEVIIGIEAEPVVNSLDFYSVFKLAEEFHVTSAGVPIGSLPFSIQLEPDTNILLAAKIWKITSIDLKAKKIEVKPANDGKKPQFIGSGGFIHPRIREKMMQILYTEAEFDFLDASSQEVLKLLKNEFTFFPVKDLERERPLLIKDNHLILYSFTGTRINNTLLLLLKQSGLEVSEGEGSLTIKSSFENFITVWSNLPQLMETLDIWLLEKIESDELAASYPKWSVHLPFKFKLQLLKNQFYDVTETAQFITSTIFRLNSITKD